MSMVPHVLASDPASFLKTNGASYLRVGSICIAAYDYVITLPAEYRFYRELMDESVAHSVADNGVASDSGHQGLQHLQTIHMGYVVLSLSFLLDYVCESSRDLSKCALTPEFAAATRWSGSRICGIGLLFRIRCTPGNSLGHLSVWLYYVLAMVYDVITLCISTYFLVTWQSAFGQMSGLFRVMFYDGLGYFVALTGANIFNLILYRAADESYQSSGASVGYAVTWIMSQRILIHLRGYAAAEHQVRQVVSRHAVQQPRDISRAMRGPFDITSEQLSKTKDRLTDEYNLTSHRKTEVQATLDVQVQIEQTVTVDYDSRIEETFKRSKGRDIILPL
ncbi:hypothetical protein NLI96_g104 [Meripilus lineatus]|uniref:Uncharacterized protein n=1 Tax=Meripilus lineatus TaxID=2056292 RepID=A0AAD5VFD1_9APHY|nr:hypothetical protein NLI96_g104 [Physisporinus lineatus]